MSVFTFRSPDFFTAREFGKNKSEINHVPFLFLISGPLLRRPSAGPKPDVPNKPEGLALGSQPHGNNNNSVKGLKKPLLVKSSDLKSGQENEVAHLTTKMVGKAKKTSNER